MKFIGRVSVLTFAVVAIGSSGGAFIEGGQNVMSGIQFPHLDLDLYRLADEICGQPGVFC